MSYFGQITIGTTARKKLPFLKQHQTSESASLKAGITSTKITNNMNQNTKLPQFIINWLIKVKADFFLLLLLYIYIYVYIYIYIYIYIIASRRQMKVSLPSETPAISLFFPQ